MVWDGVRWYEMVCSKYHGRIIASWFSLCLLEPLLDGTFDLLSQHLDVIKIAGTSLAGAQVMQALGSNKVDQWLLSAMTRLKHVETCWNMLKHNSWTYNTAPNIFQRKDSTLHKGSVELSDIISSNIWHSLQELLHFWVPHRINILGACSKCSKYIKRSWKCICVACACARKYLDVMCLVLVSLGSRHSKHWLLLRRSAPILQSFVSFCIPARGACCHHALTTAVLIGSHSNHTLNRAKLGANQDTLSTNTFSLDVQTHQIWCLSYRFTILVSFILTDQHILKIWDYLEHVENSKYEMLL